MEDKNKNFYQLIVTKEMSGEMKKAKQEHGINWQILLRSFINSKVHELDSQRR